MSRSELTPLLRSYSENNGLSVIFSIICIIDVFGVFPIVALPKAIIDCGFYGILIVLVVCSIQMYTTILLGKCWIIAENIYPQIHRKDRYPYSALAEITFGNGLSQFVEILLDLTIFGGGIPNLIFASENIQFLGLRLSDNTFDVSYCYWIMIIGIILCPILWIGSPKDMKLLCSVSVVIVTTVFILTCSCLFLAGPEDLNLDQNLDNEEFMPDRALWKTLLSAYGIIAFQFDIHPTILTIQVDMNDKTKLDKAVFGGFLATLIMFGITSTITAIKYGSNVQPSLLETLPSTTALHFAAALVAIQLCLTCAVSNSALYQHLEDCLSISREFNHKRCILRSILTFLAIIIAESVPRFDLVMSLIVSFTSTIAAIKYGSNVQPSLLETLPSTTALHFDAALVAIQLCLTCAVSNSALYQNLDYCLRGTLTGPLVFILPPLFYMKLLNLNEEHEEQLQMESFTNIIYSTEDQTKRLTGQARRYMENKFSEDFQDEDFITNTFNLFNEKATHTILCVLIVGLGICTTIVTTYLNVTDAVSYANFSKPCIFNVSAVLLYLS